MKTNVFSAVKKYNLFFKTKKISLHIESLPLHLMNGSVQFSIEQIFEKSNLWLPRHAAFLGAF